MSKKIIIAAVAVSLLTVGTMAFAETSVGVSANISVTPSTTSSTMTTKIQCVGAAVATREASIDSAMTAFTGSSNSAYSARATALAQSYTLTTAVAVRASVKDAWTIFTSSMKTARKSWQTARNSAWTQYRTSAVACKAPTGVGDGVHASSEASGL